MRFAWPQHGGNIAQALNFRLDLFLVYTSAHRRSSDLDALATSLAQLMLLAPSAVGPAILSRVGRFEDDRHDAALTTAAFCRAIVLIQLLMAGGLVLVVHPLIATLYGDEFTRADTVVPLLLPGIVAIGASMVLGGHLMGLGRPQLYFVSSNPPGY